jgi:ligand-binding sensor domain-containing protein/putative methionine-R-sulfoxide reductase with GAF domain
MVFAAMQAMAQPISFHHINTANGLSDNNVVSLAIDKTGFLWIGTVNGLNVYDGYSVTSFYKEREPGMASNYIPHMMCDSRNRIWMGTPEGASWVDDSRKIHRVRLQDSIEHFFCPTIFETKTYGIVLFTDKGQFYLNRTSNKWEPIDWVAPLMRGTADYIDQEYFVNDQIIYTMTNQVMIVDYASRKVIFEQTMDTPLSACRVDNNKVAAGTLSGVVSVMDIHTKETVHSYRLTNELNGKTINTNLTEVRRAATGELLVATNFAGLNVIDSNGNITRHTHDPLDPGSISTNNTYRVLPGANGEVVVGTGSSGVNLYNIYNRQAGYKRILIDNEGRLFDNYIDVIAEDKKGIIWLGAYDRLIRWDKKIDKISYYYPYLQSREPTKPTAGIRALCFDKTGKLWVSILNKSVSVFDEPTGTFKKVAIDSSLGPAVRSTYVNQLMTAKDGAVWVCTGGGIFTIDPATMAVNTFADHPLLKQMSGKRVIAIFEDSKGSLWMGATNEGVFCYDKINNRLKHYTVQQKLLSNSSYAFNEDRKGNIYCASGLGFNIIMPNDSIRSFNQFNGLKYDRCNGFLEDDDGNMWIANNKCLVKMDGITGAMQVFEESSNLSIHGYRAGSCYKTSDGEFLWGSQLGYNYFFPRQLVSNADQLKVNIDRVIAEDSGMRSGSNYVLSLPYSRNNVQFYFTAISLQGSRNISYQYMLEGYDKTWQQGTDIRHVQYAKLPAGNYTFRVKASIDRHKWITAVNNVQLSIIAPLWQMWWFVSAVVLLLVIGAILFLTSRNRKIKRQQEELETEKAINYFASSIYEGHSVKAILWDVVKNCIGQLHFEDCVIYLLDHERKVLIQRAAHGPKSPVSFSIKEPLEIPLGSGITGSVALTGKGEIINDTTKDPRYIVDIEQRLSEIAVPIISNGKVLGVIDCEHSKKGFFTQKHFSILTTIASLCASKIVKAKAEAQKAKAEAELMETQKKMADVEMQALRAQMNPHFIFNCLNSINRYIVKSDQATASLYLTRFAKLIRLILDNSNTKNVILSNELEALRLYIEMEALRFDKKFNYRITVDSSVSADSIEVPPLIIQPYVENAIWHGLLHKESGGQLAIHVSMIGDSMLQCIVEDDGVGREKAKGLKSKSATTRKSLGMKLTEDRISLLNKHAELNASVDIIDLRTADDEAAGTKVILKIPV